MEISENAEDFQKKYSKKKIVVAAGGTGGHIFSAIAIGDKLEKFGAEVTYFTGVRELDYKLFKGKPVIHLKSQPFSKKPLGLFKSVICNIYVFIKIFIRFFKLRPEIAFGAGGYVCGPVLLAAKFTGAKIFILEQNSVLGLTNKLLLPISNKIFSHFTKVKGLRPKYIKKMLVSGNPIREDFFSNLKLDEVPVQNENKTRLKILVFGGSLGAKSINEFVWSLVEKKCPYPIEIHHQTGASTKPPKVLKVREEHSYQWLPFIDHIIDEYTWCDLIICRAGASTISELRMIGKPVILIPYPYHKDKHQFYNAHFLQKEVSFPVYIESIKKLRENNFEQIDSIIDKEFQNKKNNRYMNNNIKNYNASIRISKEMSRYV